MSLIIKNSTWHESLKASLSYHFIDVFMIRAIHRTRDALQNNEGAASHASLAMAEVALVETRRTCGCLASLGSFIKNICTGQLTFISVITAKHMIQYYIIGTGTSFSYLHQQVQALF